MFHKKCIQTQETNIKTICKLQEEIEQLKKQKNLLKDENGLLPCPFCSHKAQLKFDEGMGGYYMWIVKCGSELFKCPSTKSETWSCFDKDLAIEKWNTRA